MLRPVSGWPAARDEMRLSCSTELSILPGRYSDMSGPIVRKYGFPNFEKIFGERPLEHGVDEGEETGEQPADSEPGRARQEGGDQEEKPETKKE